MKGSVYLAGSYADRHELRERAKWLIQKGVLVTSSWLQGLHEGLNPELAALHDLYEVKNCSLLLCDCTCSESTGGGRWTEIGLAYAYKKPVFIIGDASKNVFSHLPKILKFRDWEDPMLIWRLRDTLNVSKKYMPYD